MQTQIMGILNVTSDSFYEESRCLSPEAAVERGLEMEREGADLLDIGGESSRPYAEPASLEEELRRVLPVIEELGKRASIPLSIDTCKPEVAKKALEAGARMINDISGFREPAMQELAAASSAHLCLMHMQGTPKTMQIDPSYPEGVVEELKRWFSERAEELVRRGVDPSKIVLDPGIGFGKTVADNLEILHNLPKLKTLGYPLLIGVSRKSFLQKMLRKKAAETLFSTVAVNVYALLNGVEILRVHDVAAHREAVDFFTESASRGHNFSG